MFVFISVETENLAEIKRQQAEEFEEEISSTIRYLVKNAINNTDELKKIRGLNTKKALEIKTKEISKIFFEALYLSLMAKNESFVQNNMYIKRSQREEFAPFLIQQHSVTRASLRRNVPQPPKSKSRHTYFYTKLFFPRGKFLLTKANTEKDGLFLYYSSESDTKVVVFGLNKNSEKLENGSIVESGKAFGCWGLSIFNKNEKDVESIKIIPFETVFGGVFNDKNVQKIVPQGKNDSSIVIVIGGIILVVVGFVIYFFKNE